MTEFLSDAGERCENSGYPAGTPQHSECVRVLAQPNLTAVPQAATEATTQATTGTMTEPLTEAVPSPAK